jgi:hypothetical protein
MEPKSQSPLPVPTMPPRTAAGSADQPRLTTQEKVQRLRNQEARRRARTALALKKLPR